MSLRSALSRPVLPLPRQLARSSRLIPARAISSSGPRKADHGHDHHHDAHAGPDDTTTHETWFSAPWRNTFILVALGYIVYPFLPERDLSPASAYLSPENFERLRTDPKVPYLTRLIARNMDTAQEIEAKTDKHLEDSAYVAETRLLMQDAQAPRVRKFKSTIPDAASPWGVAVGSDAVPDAGKQ